MALDYALDSLSTDQLVRLSLAPIFVKETGCVLIELVIYLYRTPFWVIDYVRPREANYGTSGK